MKFFLYVFVSLVYFPLCAQSPQFTQFNTSPIYLNPAYTGATENLRIGFNSRLQWLDVNASASNINGGFATHGISVDKFNTRNGLGFGGYVLTDNAGNLGWNNTKLGASIAKEVLFVKEDDIRGRIGGSVRLNQYTLKHGDYVFEDALRNQTATAENIPTLSSNLTFIDVSAGGLLSNQYLWTSFTVFYTPDYQKQLTGVSTPTEFKRGLQYTLEGGGKLSINKQITAKLFAIYRRETYMQRLDVGVSAQMGGLTAGLHYRGLPFFQKDNSSKNYNNVIAPFVGIKIVNKGIVRVYGNYSFDFATSGLSRAGTIHELSLVFEVSKTQASRRKKGKSSSFDFDWNNRKGKKNKKTNCERFENSAYTLY